MITGQIHLKNKPTDYTRRGKANQNVNSLDFKIKTPKNRILSNLHLYRHSLIYAVNVGTHKKNEESKNRVNQGYLVVLKGVKIG